MQHPEEAYGRVLLVNSSLALGGLERQLIQLASNLPEGWRPVIWVVDGGPYEELCRELRLPLLIGRRRARFDVTPALRLWSVIRRGRPDVVHSWHWMTTAAALPACRALGIPLIDGSIRRGDRPPEPLRPHRLLLRSANAVVANSHAGLKAFDVSPERGRVIYNGFDPGRLREVHPAGESDDRFSVAMCARMDGDKDFDTFLDGALVALQSRPDGGSTRRWHFLLLGDGPDRDRLSRRARDEFPPGAVEVKSVGLEVMSHLSRSHVGVLMTNPRALAEGCSNAILEYMACGLPVVCTESGGNREVVLDGDTGLVIPPGDAHALASSLAALWDDPVLCRRLGVAGRARLDSDFSLERMVREYVALYEETAGLVRRSAP